MNSDASSKSYFGESPSVVSAELEPREKVECPVCHISPEPFAVDYQGFQLCRCPKCGLQFVSPRLSFEQMSENVYNDTYFPKREAGGELGEAENSYYSRQLSDFERLLGRKGKILDIGCGNGAFLDFAQKRGWEIFGTDIGLAPDAHLLNCPLWEGRIQEIDVGENRFDVIRLNHVLEHTQNPLEELVHIRQWLNPKGIIYISVPNIAGVSPQIKNLQSRLKLKKRRWRHYAAMHHLFFFSPETLRAVIEGAGLRVLHWETPVLKKSGQHPIVEWIYRQFLEKSHRASILDAYCTID